jgi:predicted outer membrane lipoprotein
MPRLSSFMKNVLYFILFLLLGAFAYGLITDIYGYNSPIYKGVDIAVRFGVITALVVGFIKMKRQAK